MQPDLQGEQTVTRHLELYYARALLQEERNTTHGYTVDQDLLDHIEGTTLENRLKALQYVVEWPSNNELPVHWDRGTDLRTTTKYVMWYDHVAHSTVSSHANH